MEKMVRWLGGSVLLASLVVLGLALSANAMGGPAPQKTEEAKTAAPVALAEKVFLVDDFESGSIKSPREWWTFELKKAEAVSNSDLKDGDAQVAAAVGKYSLQLAGTCKNWYAGGAGTYLAKEGQDLSKYTNFQMDVYGNGPGSGTIKIELVDDDAHSWSIETDPAKNYMPTKDDLWSYELKVDWQGWKRVSIPFADFVVENPGAGDGIWNIQQTNGSGGLLQMQLICLGSTDKGNINFNVDNVALTMGQ